MTFHTILRRSISTAAPLAVRLLRSPRIAVATTAVKRATLFNRSFSSDTTTSTADDGVFSDKKLLEIVQSEIEVVEQSYDHEKTVAAPSNFPFTIKDNPGQQTVTLTREYDGETIKVEVSMPNLVTGEEDDGGDDDEEPCTDSSVPFLVTVTTKDGNAPYLEFDCTAFPDEIRINGLSLKNPENEDQLAYEGPDFFDLDENLQRAFHKYLEIRGVKPSTTNFLHEYMIDKDYKEYARWLKDVKKFVEAF